MITHLVMRSSADTVEFGILCWSCRLGRGKVETVLSDVGEPDVAVLDWVQSLVVPDLLRHWFADVRVSYAGPPPLLA